MTTLDANFNKLRNSLNGRKTHEGPCEGQPYEVVRWLRSKAVWVECMVDGRRRAIQPNTIQHIENEDWWNGQLRHLMETNR